MTQEQALEILKTGANVFLTGEPGSGKTHTVNMYAQYLRARGVDPAITASTGIAATHIGGVTIHSWSGVGIKTRLDKYDLDKISSSEYVAKRIRRAKVLVIDEVSMLPPETLSMVDAVCREIKSSPEPFGGLQVIFVGDFFQLPPIIKKDYDFDRQAMLIETPDARFAYDSPAWKRANPMSCYLTEQHRQDDPDYLNILNAIRSNNFDDAYLRRLETRKIAGGSVPEQAPKLYTHNADVDRVNDLMLAKLLGKPEKFAMAWEGSAGLAAILKKGCLSPETLILKEGAEVMFTKNNSKEGYVNGTLGVVEGFEKVSGMPAVKTRNGRVIVEPAEWMVEENGKVRARISQIPLRLAWAITVHKSQGMSLDEAVMDLSEVFEFGQGYVALSRVRRLSGLHLLGWNERAFCVHPDVIAKDKEFRLSSDAVMEAFAIMSPEDLQKMHGNFINACGGENIGGGFVEGDGAVETKKKKKARKPRMKRAKIWSLK